MSYQIRKLGLSYNCEVFVNSNTRFKFNFEDNILMLDKVLIHAIFLSTAVQKTPSFKEVIDTQASRNIFLTLMGYDNQTYNYCFPTKIMAKKLYSSFDNNIVEGNEIMYIQPKLISIRNSFITFPVANYQFPDTGVSVPFTFFYEKYDPEIHQLNDWGELIETK